MAICRIFWLLLGIAACIGSVRAEEPKGPDMSVASLKSSLLQAILDFRASLPAEVKGGSAAVSLLKTLDTLTASVLNALPSDLTKRVDNIESRQEARVAGEMLLLLQQLRRLSNQGREKVGGSYSQLLADADILAYGIANSDTCAERKPRILHTIPLRFASGVPLGEVSIVGNFLDSGNLIAVTYDNSPVDVVSRSQSLVVVKLPSVLPSAEAQRRSIPITVLLQTTMPQKRVDSCEQVLRPLPTALSISVEISPIKLLALSGSISGSTKGTDANWSQTFPYDRVDGNCAANYSVTEQWCAPGGYKLDRAKPFDIRVKSANCGSAIEAVRVTGTDSRCVVVPARLVGCGSQTIFPGIVNCRGRGWLSYEITLFASKPGSDPIESASFAVPEIELSRLEHRFSHPKAGKGLSGATWTYSFRASLRDARNEIQTVELTETKPKANGLASSIDDGTLKIAVD